MYDGRFDPMARVMGVFVYDSSAAGGIRCKLQVIERWGEWSINAPAARKMGYVVRWMGSVSYWLDRAEERYIP